MKSISIILLLLIPSFLLCQVELSEKQTKNLNKLINEGNNKHLKEYCEYLSNSDNLEMDEQILVTKTKNYSDKIVKSRSYDSSQITDEELFYKMTFEAFKLCPSSQEVLRNVFNIPSSVANFISTFEVGNFKKGDFINESDYMEILKIQKDANLISNEIMVNLNVLGESTQSNWIYSYYKFYPRGRSTKENLFSEDNRVTTLTFSMTENKISKVIWDNKTNLFAILKKNLSSQNSSTPPRGK